MSEIEELKFIKDQPLPEDIRYDNLADAPVISSPSSPSVTNYFTMGQVSYTTDGAKTITVGFQANIILFFASALPDNSNNGHGSQGGYDGTTNYHITQMPGAASSSNSTQCLHTGTTNGTIEWTGVASAISATGFTLTLTKTSTPVDLKLFWVAYK